MELARTADVGLFGAPTLRRFLYDRAVDVAAAEAPGAAPGCFVGSAAAAAFRAKYCTPEITKVKIHWKM